MRESYDSNLKKAMHLYAQKSAEDFPTDDVVSDITFSPAFEKKMDKEIRRRKHSYFRIFNTAAKRAASIAAILVLLLAVSLSVEAIRTPLTNMVKLIFSDHVELEAEGDVTEEIVNIYGITELPEGFVLIFGHTPTCHFQNVEPWSIWKSDEAIGIDCGCGYEEGRLACLRLDDMKEFYSEGE